MNLESQCVSLELAKQLKEAGVPQKSLFYWWINSQGFEHIVDSFVYEGACFAAFTSSELNNMLPSHFKNQPITTVKCIKGFGLGRNYLVAPIDLDAEVGARDWSEPVFYGKTESDARAKMLLYLIQNNLINSSTISDGDK